MPHAGEIPRGRGAVVPLVRAGHAVVIELITHRLPGHTTVIRTLNQLAEPTRRLGRENPILVDRRTLDVIHLPAPEERAADVPILALAIRIQNEGTFSCTHQHSHATHVPAFPPCANDEPITYFENSSARTVFLTVNFSFTVSSRLRYLSEDPSETQP